MAKVKIILHSSVGGRGGGGREGDGCTNIF